MLVAQARFEDWNREQNDTTLKMYTNAFDESKREVRLVQL